MNVRITVALAALLALPGCFDNFDPSLYQGEAGVDAGVIDAPTADAGLTLVFGDFCSSLPVSTVPTGENVFPIDTTGAVDNMRDLGSCVGATTPGNDVFLAIEAGPSERWHFHVRQGASADVDPVLYLLDACNERNCDSDRAINVCGAGANEHLSVVAPPGGGSYYLGIDSVSAGGFAGTLEIYRPICGNRAGPEHSENCDDGNTEDGDGCDSLCRTELSGPLAEEAGVNDDFYSANHVMAADGTTVLGEIGGGCDVDVFAVDLTAGTTLTATMTGRGGSCPGLAPEARLSILAPSGTLELRVATQEACPVLTHAITTTGTYFIRVATVDNRASTFDYDLAFAVSTP